MHPESSAEASAQVAANFQHSGPERWIQILATCRPPGFDFAVSTAVEQPSGKGRASAAPGVTDAAAGASLVVGQAS
jgi:hypothetical protein